MTDCECRSIIEKTIAPDEEIIWSGAEGKPLTGPSNATLIIITTLTVIAFAATYFSGTSAEEFCAPSQYSRCKFFYFYIGPAGLVFMFFHLFARIERAKTRQARACVQIFITDRQILRVSSWPWPRVRSVDYIANKPRRGAANVITIGRIGGFCFDGDERDNVLALMLKQRIEATNV